METSVRVTGDDYERLGGAAEDLVQFVGNRAYMRFADGHCAALRIEPSGRFACTIYDNRPETCRELERGSSQCSGEVWTKAGRATAHLTKLRKAAR